MCSMMLFIYLCVQHHAPFIYYYLTLLVEKIFVVNFDSLPIVFYGGCQCYKGTNQILVY